MNGRRGRNFTIGIRIYCLRFPGLTEFWHRGPPNRICRGQENGNFDKCFRVRGCHISFYGEQNSDVMHNFDIFPYWSYYASSYTFTSVYGSTNNHKLSFVACIFIVWCHTYWKWIWIWIFVGIEAPYFFWFLVYTISTESTWCCYLSYAFYMTSKNTIFSAIRIHI